MGQNYRERSLRSWETSAAGWAYWSSRLSEAALPVTDWLIEKLGLQPGDTVLELAAGAGEAGYRAAGYIGSSGRLISTDFSGLMIAEANRRAEELGIQNVEFRVMDAERMDLGDQSVDRVLCRFGYMLMADPAAALRETRRVLRPGGRVALATFTSPERNPWALFGRGLVERGLMPPPRPGTPGIFALPEPVLLGRILRDAGFTRTHIETLDFTWAFPSFDGYWDFVTTGAGAVVGILREMAPGPLASYRDELAQRVAPFARSDASLALPASSLVGVAE